MAIAVLHDLRVGATLAVVPDPATRGGEGCRKGSPTRNCYINASLIRVDFDNFQKKSSNNRSIMGNAGKYSEKTFIFRKYVVDIPGGVAVYYKWCKVEQKGTKMEWR